MKTKRLLSFLLALVMVVGLLPMTAFAVEPKAVMLRILDARGNDLSYHVNWELVDDYFATMDSTSGSTIRVTGVRQGTSTVSAVYFSEDGMELRTDLMLDIRDTGCTLTLMDNRNGMYVQGGTMQVDVGDPVLYFGMPDEDVVIRAVYLAVPTLKLNYPSLSFEDEILYNVYYGIDDTSSVVEMGLLTFATRDVNGTVDNAPEIIPGYVNSGSTYMAQSKGVPAKNLGDALYFKVYAKLTNGSYVYSDIAGYHAVAYANSVLNNAGSSAKAKALVVAMLNYGAAAQEYFGYKTDSLMNAGLTAEQQALISAYDPSMVQDVVKAEADKVGSFIMNGGYSNIWPTVSFEGA